MRHVLLLGICLLCMSSKSVRRPTATTEYVRQDDLAARLLINFKVILFREKVNDMKNLHFLVQKNYKFKLFAPAVELASRLLKLRDNPVHLLSACKNLNFRPENAFNQNLFKKIEGYCYRKFFTFSTSTFREKKSLDLYQDYFKTHFAKLGRQSQFSGYLKRMEKDADFLKMVNSVVSEDYLAEGRETPKIFLKHLEYTPSLTSRIQSIGVSSRESKNLFKDEFIFQLKNIQNLIQQDSDAKKQVLSLQNFFLHNRKYFNEEWVWKKLISLSSDGIYKNQVAVSEIVVSFLIENFADVEINDTYFNGLWQYIYHKNWSNAVSFIEKYKLIEKFSTLSSRAKFWTAYTLQQNEEISMAIHLYKLIYQSSPLNYYSILSMKTLAKIAPKLPTKSFTGQYRRPSSPLFNEDNTPTYTYKMEMAYKRMSLWIKLKAQTFIDTEVEFILGQTRNEAFDFPLEENNMSEHEARQVLISDLVQFLTESKNYLGAFKVVFSSLENNLIDINRDSLEQLFPVDYREIIKNHASNLDPLLVLSLIRQESAFDPQALSTAGASGLMQLMPKTARHYNRKIKNSQLKNPSVNLNIGLKYFKKLLTQFDGNLIYTLASYNAGEGRVKQWKKKYFLKEDPLFQVESIPFKETRLYVKLIYRNYFFYNLLMEKSSLDVPMDVSFQADQTLNRK